MEWAILNDFHTTAEPDTQVAQPSMCLIQPTNQTSMCVLLQKLLVGTFDNRRKGWDIILCFGSIYGKEQIFNTPQLRRVHQSVCSFGGHWKHDWHDSIYCTHLIPNARLDMRLGKMWYWKIVDVSEMRCLLATMESFNTNPLWAELQRIGYLWLMRLTIRSIGPMWYGLSIYFRSGLHRLQ